VQADDFICEAQASLQGRRFDFLQGTLGAGGCGFGRRRAPFEACRQLPPVSACQRIFQ
jgi:hypothetical protein